MRDLGIVEVLEGVFREDAVEDGIFDQQRVAQIRAVAHVAREKVNGYKSVEPIVPRAEIHVVELLRIHTKALCKESPNKRPHLEGDRAFHTLW